MKNKLINIVSNTNSKNGSAIFRVAAIIFFLFSTPKIAAQSIAVTNVSATPVCAGNTVTVTFSTTNGNGTPKKKFTNSTVYTVYLSNSVGASYTQVGTTFSTTGITYSGSNGGVTPGITRVVTIPINTVTGSGYKIAIGSTTPTFNGSAGAGASAAFRINAAAIGGTVAGSSTVCYGVNSTNLTLTGHTGSVSKWQSSTVSDFSSGVTDIVNSTSSLTANNLLVTTYYRAVLANGVCTANSAVATVTVRPIFTSGSITTTGETICYNGNPALGIDSLTDASEGDGSITYVWQANGVDIPGSNSETFDPPPGLTVTTTYTRYAKDNTCNPTSTMSTGSWVVTISNNNTWTGTVSTAWTTAGNWSCGVVPESVSDVTISTASNYPEISSDVTINSLTLDSGTTLKFNSLYNLTVTDVIDNEGILTVENNANLLQTNNVANTGSGSMVVKRNSSLLKRLDYTLCSSPVTGQGLYAFSKFTLPNRFYVYDTANDVYSNSLVGFSLSGLQYPSPLTSPNGVDGTDDANVQFTNGIGYLIRVPYNHPTTPAVYNGIFTGVANNGDISAAVSTALNGYNAVGNPYPSRLNVRNFIDGNTNITGPLYFWRKTNNSDPLSTAYATLTKIAYTANGSPGGDTGTGFFPTGGSQEQNWVINIGQGFIVKATSGSTINFTNSMRRSLNADQFFRNSQITNTANNGLYWLNLNTSTGFYSQMAVGYSSEATLGFDRGIDGENINKEFYLTSLIGTGEYSIQGRADFDSSDIVPLSYKAVATGNYTISIDHTDGAFNAGLQPIYLKDNTTATYHDLNTGAYNFASSAGTFTDRFEIVYALPLGIDHPIFTANNVVVYNQNNEFVVNAGNILMSSVKVFDIRGRLLLQERKEINASQTTIGSGLVNQVLLVQITSEDGITVTKKVIR